MPSVLVRDVSDEVLKKLKARARRSGRSLQSEVQTILTQAADSVEPLAEIETARKIRASLRQHKRSDSVASIREDRAR